MERLIELRKRQNLTQQDMARILGISRQAYSNYELGNREADYTTLKKALELFQRDCRLSPRRNRYSRKEPSDN